ncbi:MAG: 3-oxoacyl-[acyl-carrier-protein] reductase [Fimbriimonadaceae bacterium]
MRLEGQIAIVTGASRGIGREIARRLAQEGATLACVASSPESGQRAADAVNELDGVAEAKGYGCNVGDAAAVKETFDKIIQEVGSPAILVNNAGITRDTLAMRMTDEQWDEVIRINLSGAFYFSRAVTKGMMKARGGRIVNVSSINGIHGSAGQANYSSSKAGLLGLTRSLAKELGPRGITVNAVSPGFIETDMTCDLPEEIRAKVLEQAPLGRLGSPQDVAGVIAFLCSPEAAYVTGQNIEVDGGLAL